MIRRLRGEYRRVGVSEVEINRQVKAEVDAYLAAHPQIRAEVESDPEYDPSAVAYTFNPDLAFEVLATLPDGAGTATYLKRLRELERARGWSLFRRPDA